MNFPFRQKKLTAYTDLNVGNYVFLFFRKIGNRYVRIDKKRISVDKQKLRYKGKDFSLIDINAILFSDNKNNYYGFDYDTEQQLFIKGNESPKNMTLDEIDEYVNKGILRQLVDELEKPQSDTGKILLWLIVGVVIGVLIGYVVGTSMTPNVQVILGVI
jgi:hypothetical protein